MHYGPSMFEKLADPDSRVWESLWMRGARIERCVGRLESGLNQKVG